ncbi:MAG: DUF3375 family protein [Actinomycetia bacterium]|nr:DUF3375 family protein [Actinomycetes bacterium]
MDSTADTGAASASAPTLAELFSVNETLQQSRAVRLLAAKNMAPYVTLMERHLGHSAKVAESELALRLEQDLEAIGMGDQTGLGLIKSWAGSEGGWLNRVSDGTGPGAQNVCSLTEDARSALAFLRRLRREDTAATGGSLVHMTEGLKRIATQLDDDPERLRAEIESQIEELYEQLADLDEGRRPTPNMVNLRDEAKQIAIEMEQIVNDIVRYGGKQNDITTGLIEGTDDSDIEFRDRQRQMFAEYDALFSSRERASYDAFTQMVQDPDQHARVSADIATVVTHLPDLDAGLREGMVHFFKRVSGQIGEVNRVQQRCSQRIRRFFASGTIEQARGLSRQINDALADGHALLRQSVVDSPTRVELPLRRSGLTSIGAITVEITDPSPPRPAQRAAPSADLSAFSGLAVQVNIAELVDLVNMAVEAGTVSLPEVIGMVDRPHLGEVLALWMLALKQREAPDGAAVRRVRFHSLDGDTCELEVPALLFKERVAAVEEA